jgi:hypothetical protein
MLTCMELDLMFLLVLHCTSDRHCEAASEDRVAKMKFFNVSIR